MAIIPSGTKFKGMSAGQETAERGSRRKNNSGEIYTIADIIQTVATDPTSVTGTVSTLAHYDTSGNLGEAGEVTVSATGEIASTADIQAANLTATTDVKAAQFKLSALGAAVTLDTPGTLGDIVINGTAMYICTVTGVNAAGGVKWFKTANLTEVS